MNASDLDTAQQILREFWGYEELRPQQRKVILGALRGRDVLALLPTGAGKSLCFQIPALALSGLTVVVSPLISLMQDQVTSLCGRGIRAAMLSSGQSPEIRRHTLALVAEGVIKLLYVAPERLKAITPLARKVGVSLLAVDEAHCISEWGHDFRPQYRSLGFHRLQLGGPPVIAVTATATAATQEDVCRVLRLRRPVRVTASFDRANLRLVVAEHRNENSRLRAAAEIIRKTRGSTIIYAPTRNRVDGVANAMRRWGIEVSPYHAGLPPVDRSRILQDFMAGRTRHVVGTNAFGMGIDYADVRAVIHLGLPVRPEAYYQEAGRAGRDGAPATCYLLWTRSDIRLAGILVGPDAGPIQKSGLDAMISYVQTRRCRRRVLLEYFGERVRNCGGCDRCGFNPA